MEKEEPKQATERGGPKGIIERFHSNILPCREEMPFARILFELIYNQYFEAISFVIVVARIS